MCYLQAVQCVQCNTVSESEQCIPFKEGSATDKQCNPTGSANDATLAVHYRQGTLGQRSSTHPLDRAVHPSAADRLCALVNVHKTLINCCSGTNVMINAVQ